MRTQHPNSRRKSTAYRNGKCRSRRPADILLVEDERFVREAACEILRAAGHSVLQARDPAEAKRAFRRHGNGIRLLISDVVMPGQDGRALAREIETLRPGLRKIFMSGYPESMVVPAGSGATFVAKPFSLDLLLRKVAEILEK
jgi:DNA-binding NtrC family response regulator